MRSSVEALLLFVLIAFGSHGECATSAKSAVTQASSNLQQISESVGNVYIDYTVRRNRRSRRGFKSHRFGRFRRSRRSGGFRSHGPRRSTRVLQIRRFRGFSRSHRSTRVRRLRRSGGFRKVQRSRGFSRLRRSTRVRRVRHSGALIRSRRSTRVRRVRRSRGFTRSRRSRRLRRSRRSTRIRGRRVKFGGFQSRTGFRTRRFGGNRQRRVGFGGTRKFKSPPAFVPHPAPEPPTVVEEPPQPPLIVEPPPPPPVVVQPPPQLPVVVEPPPQPPVVDQSPPEPPVAAPPVLEPPPLSRKEELLKRIPCANAECVIREDCPGSATNNNIRCVNNKCLDDLTPSVVEQCFPIDILNEFKTFILDSGEKKVEICDPCECGTECKSGVCLNNKCRSAVTFDALETECQPEKAILPPSSKKED